MGWRGTETMTETRRWGEVKAGTETAAEGTEGWGDRDTERQRQRETGVGWGQRDQQGQERRGTKTERERQRYKQEVIQRHEEGQE